MKSIYADSRVVSDRTIECHIKKTAQKKSFRCLHPELKLFTQFMCGISLSKTTISNFPKELAVEQFFRRIGISFLYHHANIFDIGIGKLHLYRIRIHQWTTSIDVASKLVFTSLLPALTLYQYF